MASGGGARLARWLSYATVAFIAFASVPASAQMAIDRLWVDLDSSKLARSDLVIRNEGTDRYYVTVTPSEVIDPGTPQEHRVEITDPQKLGLLVTPSRIILDPGQLRAIRIVSLDSNLTKDRIYRISITPQVGAITATTTDSQNHGLAIKLLTAFDALVTVRPGDPVEHLAAARDGTNLVLSNTGDSNILLLDGKICPAKGQTLAPSTQQFLIDEHKTTLAAQQGKGAPADPADANKPPEAKAADAAKASDAIPTYKADECARLPGRRLYAGNSWTVPEAVGEALTFNRRDAAAEDLKPITIRCDAGGDGKSDSKFCKDAGLDAATATTITSPNTDAKGEM